MNDTLVWGASLTLGSVIGCGTSYALGWLSYRLLRGHLADDIADWRATQITLALSVPLSVVFSAWLL